MGPQEINFQFPESAFAHLQNGHMGVQSSLGRPAHEMRPCQQSSWLTALHTLGSQNLIPEFRNIMNLGGILFTEAFLSNFRGRVGLFSVCVR